MFPNLNRTRPNGDFDELHDRLAAVAAAADGDPPPDPQPDPPRKQPKPGRTADGKFDRGNPGGCGNPFARQVASFREALYEAVTRDMLKDLACRLWGLAMGGNVAAARLLLQYLVGKPQDPPHPDRVDRDEWQAYQSDAVPGQEFNQLMASMPVPMAVHLAQGVWPIVAEYMIRRPMADMFKDPAAEKQAPAEPAKDRQPPQDPPSSNPAMSAKEDWTSTDGVRRRGGDVNRGSG